MPNSEMMKSTQRQGWKFVCGCEPPTGPTDCAAIAVAGLADWYIEMAELSAGRLF